MHISKIKIILHKRNTKHVFSRYEILEILNRIENLLHLFVKNQNWTVLFFHANHLFQSHI